MALKMLRFSVSSFYIRTILSCDLNLARFTMIQSKQFLHSEKGKDPTVGKINIGAPKIQIILSINYQIIHSLIEKV